MSGDEQPFTALTKEIARQLRRAFICDDCGRRFFNLGWHCEVCGSSNFHLEDE